MDTCGVETGLFSKKPCGHPAVTKCINCEQPLCKAHAVAQLLESGKHSGKYMCKDCSEAAKEHDKGVAAMEKAQKEKKLAAAVEASRAQSAAKKPPATPAPGAGPAAAAKPGAPKPEAKPEPKHDDAPLEFTPSKKPEATDKKPG